MCLMDEAEAARWPQAIMPSVGLTVVTQNTFYTPIASEQRIRLSGKMARGLFKGPHRLHAC